MPVNMEKGLEPKKASKKSSILGIRGKIWDPGKNIPKGEDFGLKGSRPASLKSWGRFFLDGFFHSCSIESQLLHRKPFFS